MENSVIQAWSWSNKCRVGIAKMAAKWLRTILLVGKFLHIQYWICQPDILDIFVIVKICAVWIKEFNHTLKDLIKPEIVLNAHV